MTPEAAKTSRGPHVKAYVTLGRTGRAAFSALSCIGLSGGGAAVFVSTNQAGTVALLAIGAASLLITVAGRMPLKWALGAGEFDLTDAAAAEAGAEVVAERLSPQDLNDLVQAMNHVSQGRPAPMSQALERYSAFERRAAARVSAVARSHGWEYVTEAKQAPRVDALVRAENGREVYLEYKMTGSGKNHRNRMHELISLAVVVGPTPLIAILSEGVHDKIPDVDSFRQQGGDMVFLDDPEFDSSLAEALSRALGL